MLYMNIDYYNNNEAKYLPKYGSIILKYKTPSILSVTLSDVIALCFGTSIAISFKLCTYLILSTIGQSRFNPGSSIL